MFRGYFGVRVYPHKSCVSCVFLHMHNMQTMTKQRKSCVSCVSLLRETQIRKALWGLASTIESSRENPMVGVGLGIVAKFKATRRKHNGVCFV